MKWSASIFLLASLLSACSRAADLPAYYSLPDFSLTDQTGSVITLRDLAGKAWVADFIFTNCGGTCPAMTDKMRKMQEVLPPGIRMVSFTVDPSRDTPRVLAAYAEEHGASRDRW